MGNRFVPNTKGFIEMRNSGYVQKACLEVAQRVGASAGSSCGRGFMCDVRPGRTRCHAMAKCTIPLSGSGFKRYSEAKRAAEEAAVNNGGRKGGYRS